MFRSKTAKRGSKKNTTTTSPITPSNIIDISGSSAACNVPVVKTDLPRQELSTESMLSALLDAESKTSSALPWLRLDRGFRMKLLRAYIEKLTDYSVVERGEILAALVEALDKKLLNSKSQISYEPTKGITDIHSLKISRTPTKLIIRIEPPNRNTKKAKRHANDSD
jgi:hypothetical protein